jgi:hypothetical protein
MKKLIIVMTAAVMIAACQKQAGKQSEIVSEEYFVKKKNSNGNSQQTTLASGFGPVTLLSVVLSSTEATLTWSIDTTNLGILNWSNILWSNTLNSNGYVGYDSTAISGGQSNFQAQFAPNYVTSKTIPFNPPAGNYFFEVAGSYQGGLSVPYISNVMMVTKP